MKESKKEIELWLKKDLDEHHLELYIDVTFVIQDETNRLKKKVISLF